MLKGARVLVAGGTGFLGMNLIVRLLSEGAQVRATFHKRPPIIQDKRIEYVQGDLTEMEDCRTAAAGMEYVFMCAANTSGAAVMANTPLAHVTPNVVMNAQMLEAAYNAEVKKFVFMSSSAAYPPSADRPVQESEMFGGDPPEVYFAVGWMKRYAEVLCRIYSEKIKKPMATLVIRPSNCFGPYDKFDLGTSHVTTALIRKVVERQNPLEVWGTGNDIRDLIYIDDFLDGVFLAFQQDKIYLPINIAAGEGHSVKEILSTILHVDGYDDADVRFNPDKPSTIPVRLIDISYAESLLGFAPKVSLEEGLRRTVAWYREHKSEWTK